MFNSVLSHIDKEQKVFIFFNSIDGIEELIELCRIEEQTNIYCSKKGKIKLKKWSNVYDNLTQEFNKYNFFTSRFYSAVDIVLDYQPVVIMLSEVCGYPNTMIDPATEAIQIAGRFRRGIARLVHITNSNKKIQWQAREKKEKSLNEQHIAYTNLIAMKANVETDGECLVYGQSLDRVDYRKFVMTDGSRNYFMYDNAFYAETIKAIYQRDGRIRSVYGNNMAFATNHKTVTLGFTDSNRRALKHKGLSNREVMNFIVNLSQSTNHYECDFLKSLEAKFPVISEAYHILGKSEIERIGFNNKVLQEELNRKKTHNLMYEKGVQDAVYATFREDKWYSTRQIEALLKPIFQQFEIPYKRSGTAPPIGHYFEIQKADKTAARGYQLGKKLI